jgi:8-oxo-dGTP pyrophosphatase MutT (NUDIX family)
MYEVFVNNSLLILESARSLPRKNRVPISTNKELKKLLEELGSKKKSVTYFVEVTDPNPLKFLTGVIKEVVAAGGLVRNSKGQVLFIYRNDKWDLPKGKRESSESLEEAAIREVMEETGIDSLDIQYKLGKTYHIFKRKGEMRLKTTHWYEMTSDDLGPFTPQLEEGITDVLWLNQEQQEVALRNSYRNIRQLFVTD